MVPTLVENSKFFCVLVILDVPHILPQLSAADCFLPTIFFCQKEAYWWNSLPNDLFQNLSSFRNDLYDHYIVWCVIMLYLCSYVVLLYM